MIEIELLTKVTPKFSLQFPEKFQPAAKVYATHCLKCHGYKDNGGFKGPPLKFILKAWPEDEKLKTFIKDPLKYKNGNSGMSKFSGPQKDLETLIPFLRHLESLK